MRQQFALVSTKKSIILDELDKEIDIRDGFTDLVELCRAGGAKFVIVSAGIDFVIEHFLRRLGVEKKVTVYSASTYDEDGHLAFRFPPLLMPGSRTFKDDVVLQWKKEGYHVTYFGDGMPDTEACAISDHRFAVRSRRLESELAKRGLPFMSFVDFRDVIPYMVGILGRGTVDSFPHQS
jgi:HAD superfamily phosphoserine phosphatase-like hydrolase